MSNPTIAVAAGVSMLPVSKILIAGAIVGIVIGIGIGIYKVIRSSENDDPNNYKNLIRGQYICDTLDGHTVMNWFQENAHLAKGEAVFFLAKPTKNTSKMFALDHVPKDLDITHCLIQCVVDESTNLPVAIRLVSFSRLSEKVSAPLGDKEYLIIKAQNTK